MDNDVVFNMQLIIAKELDGLDDTRWISHVKNRCDKNFIWKGLCGNIAKFDDDEKALDWLAEWLEELLL